jgi:hypothetical protein
MITENGWPSCGADRLDKSPIPGTQLVIPLQKGQPTVVMKAFAADYHVYVESLYNSSGGNDEGGWTPTNSVATSNHLGGTAMDLNWNDHPFQVRGTFSAQQVNTIREMLAYYEDTIYWGGDWNSPIDEMHWQMGYDTYQNPHTQDFIGRKIRSDGFSFFRKGVSQLPFERKPVVPSAGGTSWADVSQYQGRPVDHTYPYGVLCFRTNSGDQVDTLAAQNARSAKQALQTGGSAIVIPYYFFRPGEENCDLHRKVLEDAGLWNNDGTISMVDVESAGGTITGDQSWEINDEVNRLRGWYGNTRRVIGYWNPNADGGLWLVRPYALELVMPQYNNSPGDLSGVRNNIAVREAFAHQYTDRDTGVAPWSGQNVDMNWTPYTIAELLMLFGLKEDIKAPEPGSGALDLSDADLEQLYDAIKVQFVA